MKRKSTKMQPEAAPAAVTSSFFRSLTEPAAESGGPASGEGWEAVEAYLGDAAGHPEEGQGDGEPEALLDETDEPVEAGGPLSAVEPSRAPRFESEPPVELAEDPRSIRIAGIVTTMVGLGLGAASILANGPALDLLTKLAGFGLGAGSLVIGGIAMTAIGLLHAEVHRRARDDSRRAQLQERWLRDLAGNLRQGDGQDAPPAEVQAAFDRLDEKIANLTRATKLYGTPLLDISNQVGELVNRLQDLEQLGQKLEQSAGRGIDLDAVKDAVDGLEKRSDELADGLKQARRAIEDSHSEILQAMRTTHEETRRAIAEGADHVSRNFEQHAAEPTAVPAPDSIQLEELVRLVQGEVKSIATAIHRLEARPAIAASSPPVPEPSRSTAAPTPSAPAASAPTPSAPILGEDGPERIAGPRQASNKNVLGAIAKLRSMRG